MIFFNFFLWQANQSGPLEKKKLNFGFTHIWIFSQLINMDYKYI